MALGCFVFVSLLSIWYTSNIRSTISYETGIHRIVQLNDGSNQLRFKANGLVLNSLIDSPTDPQLIFGFGPIQNFLKAKKIPVMPHNELFDAIVQFGWLTVIFFAFFTLPAYNRLVSFANLEYFVPILFFPLTLWLRYLLVPSLEMLFILFLHHIANHKQMGVRFEQKNNN